MMDGAVNALDYQPSPAPSSAAYSRHTNRNIFIDHTPFSIDR
jgi:hypothetical protein